MSYVDSILYTTQLKEISIQKKSNYSSKNSQTSFRSSKSETFEYVEHELTYEVGIDDLTEDSNIVCETTKKNLLVNFKDKHEDHFNKYNIKDIFSYKNFNGLTYKHATKNLDDLEKINAFNMDQDKSQDSIKNNQVVKDTKKRYIIKEVYRFKMDPRLSGVWVKGFVSPKIKAIQSL